MSTMYLIRVFVFCSFYLHDDRTLAILILEHMAIVTADANKQCDLWCPLADIYYIICYTTESSVRIAEVIDIASTSRHWIQLDGFRHRPQSNYSIEILLEPPLLPSTQCQNDMIRKSDKNVIQKLGSVGPPTSENQMWRLNHINQSYPSNHIMSVAIASKNNSTMAVKSETNNSKGHLSFL